MANRPKITKIVDIMWKSTLKTLRFSREKQCAKSSTKNHPRGNLHFFANFSHLSHNFTHNYRFPVSNQSFPLLHRPYYYYYYIY